MIALISLALAGVSETFTAANTALAGGDLAAAQRGYTEIVASGVHDADVYYNLGNVLFRQDHVPEAVAVWRRGALLAPRDADLAANLDFARRDFVDAIAPAEPTPVWAPWQAALTPDEGQWLGGLLAGAGLLAVAARRRFSGAPVAGLGAAGCVFGVAVGLGAVAESSLPPAAVVLADSVTVRSDLGAGVDLFVLHAGAEVLTAGNAGNYVLVVLPDGRKGWVAAADVSLVDLAAPLPLPAAG